MADASGWPRALAGWIVGEQADDVGARGGQRVLHVCLREAFLSAAARAVSADDLRDGGLAPGADRMALLVARCLLLKACSGLDLPGSVPNAYDLGDMDGAGAPHRGGRQIARGAQA